MSKIALITDTHAGARGDSPLFLKFFDRFYYEFFFPELKKRGIKSIFHLGDIVERRKYINFLTARYLRRFVQEVSKNEMELDVLIGNHDIYFRNSNDVNSMKEIFSDSNLNIRFYDKPTEIKIGNLDVVMMPWINSTNHTDCMEMMQSTKAQILFGHLEIQGFEMYRGSKSDHGFDRKIFQKFDMVLSGHYHHKSSADNIHYLGSPFEITWSDWNDPRGFHIFDTETRELEYIENPFKMFHKIVYRDGLELDFEKFENTFIKVMIHENYEPKKLDAFLEVLEKSNPHDITIIDETNRIDISKEAAKEDLDTWSLIKKEVQEQDLNIPKDKLLDALESIYYEARMVE